MAKDQGPCHCCCRQNMRFLCRAEKHGFAGSYDDTKFDLVVDQWAGIVSFEEHLAMSLTDAAANEKFYDLSQCHCCERHKQCRPAALINRVA